MDEPEDDQPACGKTWVKVLSQGVEKNFFHQLSLFTCRLAHVHLVQAKFNQRPNALIQVRWQLR